MSDQIYGGIPKEGEVRGPALANKLKTHCTRGHELAGENVVEIPNGLGRVTRQCRECQRIYGAQARGKARARKIKKKVGDPPFGCI